MHACHYCGAAVEDPRNVHRASTCASCRRDLKICLNCKFYSSGSHWDCAETIDEPVGDKERSNFCAFFAFRDSISQKGAREPGTKQARRALDQLFGNDQ